MAKKKKKKKKAQRPKSLNPEGWKTILTDELQEKIVNNIKMGCYVETSCEASGISKAVYYKWLKRGNNDINEGKITRFSKFVDAVHRAVGYAEARDVSMLDAWCHGAEAVIKNGRMVRPEIKPVWQAVAWRLERKYQDRWGRKQEVEIKETTHKRLVDLITGVTEKEVDEEEFDIDDLD